MGGGQANPGALKAAEDGSAGREALSVSVVIPTRGRRASVAAAIAAARAALASAGLRHEILVGLDRAGSEPGGAVPGPWLDQATRIVELCDSGPSRARNAAAELARGDIIAFLDDDIVVDSDWGDGVARLGPERRAVVWAGALRAPGADPGEHARRSREEEEAGLKDFGEAPRDLGRREYGAAGHMLMSRAAWSELRGFSALFGNPRFFGRNEDVEVFCRARRRAIGTRWEPALRAVHLFPRMLGAADCFEQGKADFAVDIRYDKSMVPRRIGACLTRHLPAGSARVRQWASGYLSQAAATGVSACRRALRTIP